MRSTVLALLYAAAFTLLGWLAWTGRSYYATPLLERPHHPQHWELKPGGTRGRALGIAGAAMIVTMLGYTLRKRLPFLRRAAPLSVWLDAHIFLGTVGPLLIVLHTSFKVHGLVAVAFWSMVAVALSGVVGRFIYLQLPRTAAGDELTLSEALALDEELTERLRRQFRLEPAELAELDALAGGREASAKSLLRILLGLPFERLRVSLRLAAFRRRCRHVPAALLSQFTQVARQKALLRRRLVLWDRLREVFHYWHVFHKPFAVLLYLFMAVHIAVAYMTGYSSLAP